MRVLWILCFLFPVFAGANSGNIQTEERYDQFVDAILAQNMAPVSLNIGDESKLFVDAVWDTVMATESQLNPEFLRSVDTSGFSLPDQLRWHILLQQPELASPPQSLIDAIESRLSGRQFTDAEAAQVLSNVDLLDEKLATDWMSRAEKNYPQVAELFSSSDFAFRNKSQSEIKDLFFKSPDLSNVRGGKYAQGVRLFVFCRYHRYDKCLMIMKDKDNQPVFKEDGKTLWSHPALAMSRLRKPSWKRNGNTPEGVMTIDGVMPSATKPRIFGKYRRMILNFVPKSNDESLTKEFLPESAHTAKWWKSSVVARDIGRNLLRIHGSGIKRSKKRDPFHPLRPTLGCIMQRELKFGRVEYHDQRKLLDQAMKAMGLEAKYENETKIKGVLYLIELDRKKKPVTLKEIESYLGL